MERIFFIDLDGNIIENEEYGSHIGLAMYIIDNNENLKQAFMNSGNKKQDLFLVNDIGYILGSSSEYNRFLILNKEKTTTKQKQIAITFIRDGYEYYFSDDEKTKSRF